MTAPKITRRVGSVIGLRKEWEERYVILHRHTFPGVLDRIQKSRIRNYSIFLRDGILFSHYEYIGKNERADMRALAKDETTRQWWKLTDPMQRPLPSRPDGAWWSPAALAVVIDARNRHGASVQRIAFTGRLRGNAAAGLSLLTAGLTSIAPLLREYRTDNLHLYGFKHTAYLYFEYAGTDYRRDLSRFVRQPETAVWKKTMRKALAEPFRDMREVFHSA